MAPLELVIGLDGAGAGPAQDHSPRLTGVFIKPYERSTNPAPYSFGLTTMTYSLDILYIPEFLRSFYCRGYYLYGFAAEVAWKARVKIKCIGNVNKMINFGFPTTGQDLILVFLKTCNVTYFTQTALNQLC